MIETRVQAVSAVDEIAELTGWSYAEIARRSGICKGTMRRLRTGKMKWPGEDTRRGLTECLIHARNIPARIQ
jgi:transcriptional regulator with XRE-family HTH domain